MFTDCRLTNRRTFCGAACVNSPLEHPKEPILYREFRRCMAEVAIVQRGCHAP
jgi:hypothetical protein